MKKIEKELMEMVEAQKSKLLASACRIFPHLTLDDILQPQDYPELETDAEFRFEEGFLMGLESSLAAVRASDDSVILMTD
jgi:hypothetical protein